MTDFVKKYKVFLTISIFLFVIFIQVVTSMRRESPTYDEVIHMPSKLVIPNRAWNERDPLGFGHTFLYLYNNNADQIVFWSRIPIVLLSMLLAFFVFKWAEELYGFWGGFLALFLFSFEPNILAHSRLSTSDLGVAVFIFIAIYRFLKFVKNPTKLNLIWAGITFGLAQASKFSAPLIIPIYLLLIIVLTINSDYEFVSPVKIPKKFKGKSLKFYLLFVNFIIILFLSYLVIFVSYGGKVGPIYSLKAHGGEHPWFVAKVIPQKFETVRKAVYYVLEEIPVPANEWFRGLLRQFEHSRFGQPGYLMGKSSETGWWYYYIFAFLIKTPIALLILIGVSLVSVLKARTPKYPPSIPPLTRGDIGELAPLSRGETEGSKEVSQFPPLTKGGEGGFLDKRLDFYFIIIPIAFFILISFFNKIAIGLRYLLPMYPFLFVLAASVVKIKINAYFNEFAGGPENGYKYLVDSNLDWGQDLKGLREYQVKNKLGKIKLSYFGTANPDYYKLNYVLLDNDKEGHSYSSGIYAISATNFTNALVNDKERFSWIKKKYKPVVKIGYSIFVYDIK
ncbi:MAG: glycosyltransferase family 39 protein [Actinobacteria bacterium]|nr:glycosyltransferase family 39 protein [Actinomycetota bacterium]